MEAARGDHRGLPRLLLPADRVGALSRRPHGVARAVEVVRARARAALPGAGVLHRRRDLGLRQPGVGDAATSAPRANKVLAYGVASVSGTILAVCSCTVLPLFAGIYRMGAGLGPATAFLYSGPAINVLAIILTARILGLELGVARAVGAVVFSVVIGLLMHLIYRREEADRAAAQADCPRARGGTPAVADRAVFRLDGRRAGLRQLGPPADGGRRSWQRSIARKWLLTGGRGARPRGDPGRAGSGSRWWKVRAVVLAAAVAALRWRRTTRWSPFVGRRSLGLSVVASRDRGELRRLVRRRPGASPSRSCRCCSAACWSPGLLLGRPGHEGLIPSRLGEPGGRRQLARRQPLRLGGRARSCTSPR